MTARFFASAGKLYERVARETIERDPFELRRLSEAWFRDAITYEHTDFPRAKLYDRSAFEAQCALTIWEQHYRAVFRDSPFKEDAA